MNSNYTAMNKSTSYEFIIHKNKEYVFNIHIHIPDHMYSIKLINLKFNKFYITHLADYTSSSYAEWSLRNVIEDIKNNNVDIICTIDKIIIINNKSIDDVKNTLELNYHLMPFDYAFYMLANKLKHFNIDIPLQSFDDKYAFKLIESNYTGAGVNGTGVKYYLYHHKQTNKLKINMHDEIHNAIYYTRINDENVVKKIVENNYKYFEDGIYYGDLKNNNISICFNIYEHVDVSMTKSVTSCDDYVNIYLRTIVDFYSNPANYTYWEESANIEDNIEDNIKDNIKDNKDDG